MASLKRNNLSRSWKESGAPGWHVPDTAPPPSAAQGVAPALLQGFTCWGHEEKERSNIEKLGLCGLSSLMKRCVTPEAQHIYYTLLNEKVSGVVMYG